MSNNQTKSINKTINHPHIQRKWINIVKIADFRSKYVAQHIKSFYICNVFFMVLDLRLAMRIGCRDDNLSFLYIPIKDSDHI